MPNICNIQCTNIASNICNSERNSRYFLNLEKCNYNERYMKLLINSQGLKVTEPSEILDEQAKYYESLYTTSRSKISQGETFLNAGNIPQLNNEQKIRLDNPLSLIKISEALKEMANDKSGLDGFTTNFYKFFWVAIRSFLYDSYIYSMQHSDLSVSQRRGPLVINSLKW